jgi:hypothetical protein
MDPEEVMFPVDACIGGASRNLRPRPDRIYQSAIILIAGCQSASELTASVPVPPFLLYGSGGAGWTMEW